MKLVIGLGNPGPEYVATRHNVGFMAVERLIDDLKGKFKTWGQQKNALLADVSIDGERVLVLKPLTYMNLSGQAAVAAAHFYKILPEDICVLHDELDLPLGTVRLKTGGGPGGHNGLRSLIASLATPNFSRVRMGVG
ncbi:MAG TPA: aminoacyl-tRNA hydrolase, partial [Oligoflexia bacterium]|nr:aminoacyl-tRNA hydrolase [Oligoflexia bacterium]